MWGKIIGGAIGSILGPIGTMAGIAIGHAIDSGGQNDMVETDKNIKEELKLEDALQYEFKVAGVTYDNRQELIHKLDINSSVYLRREVDNMHDINAIAVYNNALKQLGYVPKEYSSIIASKIPTKGYHKASVSARVGGANGMFYGLRIKFVVPKGGVNNNESIIVNPNSLSNVNTQGHNISQRSNHKYDGDYRDWYNNTYDDQFDAGYDEEREYTLREFREEMSGLPYDSGEYEDYYDN